MRKIYLSVITALLFISGSFAQTVTVTGADPVTNAGSPYTTLKAAFDNINLASQAGNVIVITVTGITVEPATASLNQSVGPWTSLTIIPVGASQITGNINGHLVDLNGADNVTIDGLNSGGNSLAIANTNGLSSSTVRFIADASSNTITRCNLLGSTGNTAGLGLGTVYFSTGTVTGNDNNTITQCNISASSGGTPQNAIYSLGSSAVIDNSNNTISINNISDYFYSGASSAGLNINSFNSGWTITNNALYQTATRIVTTPNTYNGIFIASGVGYNISNNVIGFANPSATGTTNMIGYASGTFPGSGTFPTLYTPGGTANATRYNAINCAFTAGGAVSSIQNNTIGGIALYTSSGANTTFGVICGIAVTSGNANIGTVTGNTVGSTSGTSSIYVASTTAGAVVSGIYCTTTNSISIQNNTIGGIDVSGTSATTAAGFKGIEGAGSGTYTISNNNIGNTSANNIRTGYLLTAGSLSNAATTPTTATGTSAFTGILNSSTGSNIDITGNTLQGFLMSGSATTFAGISNTAAVTGNINILNNNVGSAAAGLLTIAFANSGAIACISNTGGGAAATLNITGNTVRGMTYNANCTGAFQCISATATIGTENINNNNFTNLTVNTNNATQGFLIGASNGTTNVTVSGNAVVTQFTNTNAGGANYFAIANLSAVPTSGSSTISNNILSNITVKTTTSYAAMIYWAPGTGAACTHNISVTGNTLYNNANASLGTATQAASLLGIVTSSGSTNLIANNDVSFLSAAGGGVTGIIPIGNSTNTTTGNTTVRNNIVHDIKTTSVYSGTAAGSAVGIQIQSGPVNNYVYKNKIYNILSVTPTAGTGGTVTGIVVAQATATSVNNVYNNIIGQLYATNSTFFQSVRGINIGNSVANTTNVYYNTVYIDGTPGNQSYCLYMTNNTANSTLRNNIFINNASSAVNPQFAIFRNGASSLGTYSTASNNNILYCGTPGSLNLIYADGAVNALTNQQQTLAAFQVFVGPTRENLSKTEFSPFINTTFPANLSYLHINPTIVTQAESGAVNIATYSDDYEADIRQGNPGYPGTSTGTAPDIGADEFDVTIDHYGPEISYTALATSVCTASKTFTATISDYSGVNITAGTLPRVYYKKLTNANGLGATNDNTTNGWKYAEATFLGGNSFSFTIDYSLVFGGVAAGDNIQYFVTAQDLFSPVNVGINSGTFALAPAGVNLTAAAFPVTGTINSYNIVLPVPTVITIGAAGTYTSLSGAGGLFADLNSKGLAGNTVVTIIDPSVTETGANALNQLAYDCAGPYTLTIKPNAAGTVITGSLASNSLLRILSNNVIIDGSSNGSSSRDLTITNTSATVPSVIRLGSTGTVAITNTTVKNTIIINGVNTSSAVYIGDGAAAASAGYFTNITLQNNDIQKAYIGIYSIAIPVSGNGSGLNITGNTLNAAGANAIRLVGLYVQGVDGATVSGNDIGNFESASGEIDRGVWFATGTTNSVIEKNNIHDLQYTGSGGYGTKGISISTGLAAANITIRNNMISGMTGDGDSYISFGATYCPVGIYAFGAGQGGINIYYNSVHLYGSTLNFAADVVSAGIALDNNTSASIKNNIVLNELGLLAANGIGAVGIAAFTSASQFTALDFNDYYSAATLGTNLIGKIGAADYATLAVWQTATAQEANSLNVNPNFTSATDLHLLASNNCRLDGYGIPIAGITTDYDLNTRDIVTPDMGADEFTTAPVSSTMSTASNCDTKNVSPLGTLYLDGSCNLIAKVLPSGGSAVNGKIKACVTLDVTQQTFNGQPYVQRHYDIEPTNSPATATSTITLYFTDGEFAQYNTNYPAYPPLPTVASGGNGSPNLGNVKVTQFHGVGSTNPTQPGFYPGTAALVTPVSTFYNGSFWELTFNVTGFSGFYVHTNNFNAPLPIVVNFLTGRRQGSNHLLNWKVTCNSTPRATMTLERSSDSRTYTGINTITADAARCNSPFDYTDANPLKGMNYYRLKVVDADGKVTYSTTVALLNAVKGFDIISIAPNPVVNDRFNLNIASAVSGKMEIAIFDMQGRLVDRQMLTLTAGFNTLPVNVANLQAGTYTIRGGMADDQSKVIRFVKQ